MHQSRETTTPSPSHRTHGSSINIDWISTSRWCNVIKFPGWWLWIPKEPERNSRSRWTFPPLLLQWAQGRGLIMAPASKPTGLSPNPLHLTGGTKSLFMAKLRKYQAIYQADSNVTWKQMSYLSPRYQMEELTGDRLVLLERSFH